MWKYFFSRSKAGPVLLVSDVCALVVFFNIAHRLHIGTWLGVTSGYLIGVIIVTLIVLYILDLYRADLQFPSFGFPARAIFGVALSAGLIAALVYLLPGQTTAAGRETIFWRGVLAVAMVMFALWAAISRFILSAVVRWIGKEAKWLVLGSGDCAKNIWRDFMAANINGELLFLMGDERKESTKKENMSMHIVDSVENMDDWINRRWVGIVVGMDGPIPDRVVSKLMKIRLRGVRVFDVVDFYERYLLKIPVFHLKDGWFALSHGFNLLHHNVQLRVKRIIDVVSGCIALILLSPIMLAATILIKLDSKGAVIYRQERMGANEVDFVLYKFRTMIEDAELEGAQWAKKDDPRITRTGNCLRSMRIDELPQLWNVIKGDMSFIGPRPERKEFNETLEKDIPYYSLRRLVKPGITGWAQVQYPYGASVDDAREKLQYDLFYIKNYSIMLDVAIAIKTIRVVLFGRGR